MCFFQFRHAIFSVDEMLKVLQPTSAEKVILLRMISVKEEWSSIKRIEREKIEDEKELDERERDQYSLFLFIPFFYQLQDL